MMVDLYNYSLLTIFLTSLAVVWAVTELGWQIAVRGDGRGGANISTLETAALGLLALMIGFTFAMVLERFDARRNAVLMEANAIGTTALRARLLPEPHRAETVKLLREYVQIRLDVISTGTSLLELENAVDRSNAVQEGLWQHAMAMAAKDKALVPTGLFIQALNEMIDNQEVRLTALRNRVPNIVPLALYAIAAAAAGFAGYASALEARRTRLPAYIMGLLVLCVIYVILDLDRPSSGFITNNQQAMIDMAASIRSIAAGVWSLIHNPYHRMSAHITRPAAPGLGRDRTDRP